MSRALSNPAVRNFVGKWTKKLYTGGSGIGTSKSIPTSAFVAGTAADFGKGFVQEGGEDLVNAGLGTDYNLPEFTPGAVVGADLYKKTKEELDNLFNSPESPPKNKKEQ